MHGDARAGASRDLTTPRELPGPELDGPAATITCVNMAMSGIAYPTLTARVLATRDDQDSDVAGPAAPCYGR